MKVTKAHSLFCVQSFFQFIQWIFLSSFVCPHQYFASKELMLSHVDLGNLKMLMAYVRIACATVLIRISRPAFEINFSFHPMTHFVTFSCRSLKVVTFDFPLAIGKPRYFSLCVIILPPNICRINVLTSSVVFLLKNKAIFWQLMAWLEAASYWPKICNSYWHSPIVALQKRRLANRRWDMRTPCWLDKIPCSTRVSAAFLNNAERPSTHRRNR